jgi:hypothetical protein
VHLIRTFLQTSVLASMVLTSFSLHINPASAQQRACVITTEGNTVCGKLTTSKKVSKIKQHSSSSRYRTEIDDFVFLLNGCRRNQETIKCYFTITNKGEERDLMIYPQGSKIIGSGKESYLGSSLYIGGVTSIGSSTTMVKNYDYSAIITFENIPYKTTKASIFSIMFIGPSPARFFDVPLSD